MFIKKLLLLTLLTLNVWSSDNSIGIDINSKDVEVLASININSLSHYSDGTTYIFDASYLNSNGSNLITLGISGHNMFQGLEGLSLAFGLKAAMASDFLAFPLHAKAIYQLPLIDTFPPTYINATLAYAPAVLSFISASSLNSVKLCASLNERTAGA